MKIFFLLFFLVFGFQAKPQFKIDGEIRTRSEYRYGYRQLVPNNTYAAIVILQRTRLNFAYSSNIIKNSNISIQDLRTWGDEKIKTDVPSLGIHEAWMEFKITDSLSLKAGRQELIYGNQRILSNSNWQQQTTKHDAAVFKFNNKDFNFHSGLAYNQQADTIMFGNKYSALSRSNYQSMFFLWITKKFGNLNAGTLDLLEGWQNEKNERVYYTRSTHGFFLDYKLSSLGFYASTFHQYGRLNDGKNINAYYMNLEGYYSLNKIFQTKLGGEYFSGSDSINYSKNISQSFRAPYGSAHNFNGFMDYFTDIPTHTKQAGLIDLYFKTKLTFSEKLHFNLDYHYFQLAKNYYLNSNQHKWIKITPYLGSEIDFTMNYKITSDFNIEVGYCFMLPSPSMEKIKQGNIKNFPNWGYISLLFKPIFYSPKQ